MGYDEESIRKAREKGIFNDSFDPLALGLSEEEKKRMTQGFKELQSDPAKQGDGADARLGGKQGSRRKQATAKLSIFERLVRFILLLFTGQSFADYEKKKRVKELKQALKRFRPQIYNFQTETITEDFAKLIHDLVKLLWPYRVVFEDVFGEDDAERHLDFQLHYIRNTIETISEEEIARFSEEGLKEFVRTDRDAVARKRIGDLIEAFLRNFDEDSRRRLNRNFADFLNVKEMIGFNFFSLLRRFNASYTIESEDQLFHDIRPDGVGETLKDLESMLLAINTKALPSVLGLAADYYRKKMLKKVDQADSEAILLHFQKMEESDYRMLIAAISRIVAGQQLCFLIRYITKNLDYESYVYPKGTNFFEEFRKGLSTAITTRLDRILAKRKQEEVNAKLKELFETFEPIPEFLYSDATNKILTRLDLPVFIYPTAFYVAIRFYDEKYYQYIKRNLNKLIVDGSFKDSLARRTLADEFYKMDDLSGRLTAFSNSINIQKEKGSVLQGMLQKFKGDLASKKALGTRIATINQELHAVLQDTRACVTSLQNVLVRIGHDIDSVKPEIVDNLHKIGSSGNTRFLGELKRSIREIVLFSDIISKVFKDA